MAEALSLQRDEGRPCPWPVRLHARYALRSESHQSSRALKHTKTEKKKSRIKITSESKDSAPVDVDRTLCPPSVATKAVIGSRIPPATRHTTVDADCHSVVSCRDASQKSHSWIPRTRTAAVAFSRDTGDRSTRPITDPVSVRLALPVEAVFVKYVLLRPNTGVVPSWS